MNAIQTSFVGATGKRDAKIVAKCGISKLSIPFNSEHDMVQNHAMAAEKIALELGMVLVFVGAKFADDWYWNPRHVEETFNVADALSEPVKAAESTQDAPKEEPATVSPVEALDAPTVDPVKPARIRRAA